MERHMRIRGFAPSTPCWVELTTADPARAAGFYADLFGWRIEGDRFLKDGRVVASGPAAGIVTTEHVSAAFDHPIRVIHEDGRWAARAGRATAAAAH